MSALGTLHSKSCDPFLCRLGHLCPQSVPCSESLNPGFGAIASGFEIGSVK